MMKLITLLFFVSFAMGLPPIPVSRAFSRSWNEGKRNLFPGKEIDDEGASNYREMKRSYWAYLQNDF